MAPALEAPARGVAEPCQPQVDELRNLINSSVDPNRLHRLRLALTTHLSHSHYRDWPEATRLELASQTADRLASLNAQLRSRRRAPPQRPAPVLEQFDLGLFGGSGRLPRRPYCANDLETGLRIRSLAGALSRPYIQPNPPNLRIWSIYDIDRPGAAAAWEAAGLPAPNWAAVNRDNGHAHLVWGLTAPVLVDSPEMRRAPLRYLCAVEAAYRTALQADQGFGGLITKNPVHPLWHTLRGPQAFYTLEQLAAEIDLPRHLPRRKPEEIGLGRNVTVFEWLRQYAYRNIRRYKGDVRNFVLWQSHLNSKALERNGEFLTPMDGKEVWHIAKSVARWTWRRFDLAASDVRFSALQAHRGARGGVASGKVRAAVNEDRRASARLMRAKGMTLQAIADTLGAHVNSVANWLRN